MKKLLLFLIFIFLSSCSSFRPLSESNLSVDDQINLYIKKYAPAAGGGAKIVWGASTKTFGKKNNSQVREQSLMQAGAFFGQFNRGGPVLPNLPLLPTSFIRLGPIA